MDRKLILVMILGLILWSIIFIVSATSYLNVGPWNKMYLMIGPHPDPGYMTIFGYTIPFQFEGFTDYAYYYIHWGNNVLRGVSLYSPEFGNLYMDGIYNRVGTYIFPPLTAWLYAIGVLIHPRVGVGILIVGFGYLTALPIYGIARDFSKNDKVGALAAATYLFNPLVLYYIVYLWLNPATFYFFIMLGVYYLIKDRDMYGAISIVIAMMFKQTAWFVVIPLIIYLFMKDKKQFILISIVCVWIVSVVMLQFIADLSRILSIWVLALKPYYYTWGFEYPHDYGFPTTLVDTVISFGYSDIAGSVFNILSSGAIMYFGILICIGFMIRTMRMEKSLRISLKNIIFITFIMLLWIHIFGPRGVFKYYFTFLAPFFSIFSSETIISTKNEASVSGDMFWIPSVIGILIIFPIREIYLLVIAGIMILYVFHRQVGSFYKHMRDLWDMLKCNLRYIWKERNNTERRLIILMVLLIICMPVYGQIAYDNGYDDGYLRGDLDAQREVIIFFGDLIDMPCARNITIIGIDGRNYFSSFVEFRYNFTFHAGQFYLGSTVLINITLFFNITAGYNDNTTLFGSYIVGGNPIVENWLFIRDVWISMVILKVYEEKIL